MFNITQPIRRGALPGTTVVRKQAETTKATHEPNFGLTTVSFGQPGHKVGPLTPHPTQPKAQGTRLDYYA